MWKTEGLHEAAVLSPTVPSSSCFCVLMATCAMPLARGSPARTPWVALASGCLGTLMGLCPGELDGERSGFDRAVVPNGILCDLGMGSLVVAFPFQAGINMSHRYRYRYIYICFLRTPWRSCTGAWPFYSPSALVLPLHPAEPLCWAYGQQKYLEKRERKPPPFPFEQCREEGFTDADIIW